MELRKDIENLAIWYIPVFALMLIITGFSSNYIQHSVHASITAGEQLSFIVWFIQLLSYIDNVVIGVWLWKIVKRENGRFVLWFLLGLVSSLFAALIYLVLKVYENISLNSQSSSKVSDVGTL